MKRLVAPLALVLVLVLAGPARLALAAPPAAATPALDPLVPYPPPTPRVLKEPERAYTFTEPQVYPSLLWIGAQLLPSPEVAVGQLHEKGPLGTDQTTTDTAFGLRWQVTPLLWSWGTNRHVSRWRSFVVDPLARHSGSLELSGSLEWFFGYVDRVIARPGVRAYFPVSQRGEYLSVSLGTSMYGYDEKVRVAYDFGAYFLFGLFGLQTTIAPNHAPLSLIGTFRIRYF